MHPVCQVGGVESCTTKNGGKYLLCDGTLPNSEHSRDKELLDLYVSTMGEI